MEKSSLKRVAFSYLKASISYVQAAVQAARPSEKWKMTRFLQVGNLLKPTFCDICVAESIVFVDPTCSKPLTTQII